jgi:glutamate--cysteine ligase
MVQDQIHPIIVKKLEDLRLWFRKESEGLFFPFYSSFDIRDSGIKVAPVDANIFPAGFNNICPTDQESAVELIQRYFKSHYSKCRRVILLTEEHTQNPYYWDNAHTLWRLMNEAGLEVKMAIPRKMPQPLLEW